MTVQAAASPRGVEPQPVPRAERVAGAAARWSDELAALGGRNTLLHFRDLKAGTLDLAAADPENRRRLLDGEPVPVSRLFPHEPLRSSALRSARAIRDKVRELAEERGLDAAMLAIGLATWANPFAAHRPVAPVLLRPATVVARDPAETDFVITLVGGPEVNPVLLRELDSQLGLRFGPAELHDSSGALRYPVVVERLREFAPAHVVDGFSISHRAVLGTFAAAPAALARDIAAFGAELERHDAVAALAGDPSAAGALRDSGGGDAPEPTHLVLEADSRQSEVVAAIAAGGDLRVEAPPGTGRTQTVANAVAELVARGQRVLVVSNKRATLADLTTRLDVAGLGDVVLDLVSDARREAVTRIAQTARRLGDESGRGRKPPSGTEQADPLQPYLEALHRRREPWGVSAYDVVAAVSAAEAEVRTDARIDADGLARLGVGSREAMRAKLREYAELGGLVPADPEAPWHGATVPTSEHAEALATAVEQLRSEHLPALRDAATRAAVEAGLAAPASPADAFTTIELLTSVEETLNRFRPQIWQVPLDELVAGTADRSWRAEYGSRLGVLTRRRLRLEARDLLLDSAAELGRRGRRVRRQLHEHLVAAADQLATWHEHARDPRPPRTGPHLHAAVEAVSRVREPLELLAEASPRLTGLTELPYGELAKRLAELSADRATLIALPRLAALRREAEDVGLSGLLDDLRKRQPTPREAEAAFTYAWQASLLDLWRDEDPALREVDGSVHERHIERFRDLDIERARRAAAGVIAERARRFREVSGEHEGQTAVVCESTRTSRVPPALRELVSTAPDVALAALPCWVCPSLTVAEHLPARRLFDVVVVEDAGQLSPAEAVPVIARADRVVLVGDREQLMLPPFTVAVEPTGESDDFPALVGEEPPPSVLDLLEAVLPRFQLTTGYRFRDDRLVGFVRRNVYRGRLSVLPGVGGPSRLHHELVGTDIDHGGDEGAAHAEGGDPAGDDVPPTTEERASSERPRSVGSLPDSSEAEVRRVVELVLEHARTRPHESLGVITLSRPHASRVASALRAELIRAPDAAPFLRDDREEPFFIKDVDHVCGDVRDAVIFTLGYGRSVDGRVLYRFGALDRPGGERRLAAAATRARERLTVVSSFGAADLSPRRLTTAGGRALRDFLAYAEEPTRLSAAGEADPLATTVAARLRTAGASVVVGYGSGAGRLDVAVRHPSRWDRFVLAIETDGPAYARTPSVRDRDRLRPEQLRRLGWSVYRVWAGAWAADPDGETGRLIDAYAKAVAAADAYDWAVAAAEAGVVAEPSHPDEDDDAPPDEGSGENEPARVGPRPPVPLGRPVGGYTRQELVALARWVESDGVARSEDEVVTLLDAELSVTTPGSRAEDVFRHAVRVARSAAVPA